MLLSTGLYDLRNFKKSVNIFGTTTSAYVLGVFIVFSTTVNVLIGQTTASYMLIIG